MKIGNQVKPIELKKAVEPRFKDYECVELTGKLKGTRLKKGDLGTVMDSFDRDGSSSYIVTFEDKNETVTVPGKKLKAAPLPW